jgi:hypothetical protein
MLSVLSGHGAILYTTIILAAILGIKVFRLTCYL